MQPEHQLKTAIDHRFSAVEVQERHIRAVLKQAQRKPRRVKPRTLILVFALVALAATALALNWSTTVNWMERVFGNEWAEELKISTHIPVNQTKVLGEVQYEWLETIHVGEGQVDKPVYSYGNNALYGSIRITPVPGANIVLIPEEFQLTDPLGYHVYWGETAPEGTPSYLDVAIGKDARIVLAKAVPHGILMDGQLQEGYEIMYDFRSNPDGSLLYHFEIPMVKQSTEYAIHLRLNNWEVTREGQWLREGPTDTWLKEDWILTIRPEAE